MPFKPFILAFPALCASNVVGAQPLREVAVPGFSCSSGAYVLKLPKSLSGLRNLSKLEAEKTPRKEVGWEDYRVLYFQGLEVGISIADHQDQYKLEYTKITGPEWSIAGPLRVGATASATADSLRIERPVDEVWKLWGPGPEQALIKIKAGFISQVTYHCYTG